MTVADQAGSRLLGTLHQRGRRRFERQPVSASLCPQRGVRLLRGAMAVGHRGSDRLLDYPLPLQPGGEERAGALVRLAPPALPGGDSLPYVSGAWVSLLSRRPLSFIWRRACSSRSRKSTGRSMSILGLRGLRSGRPGLPGTAGLMRRTSLASRAVTPVSRPQRPALLLGQAAPDTVALPGSQRVRQAVVAHLASGADGAGTGGVGERAPLIGDGKEDIGCECRAGSPRAPVLSVCGKAAHGLTFRALIAWTLVSGSSDSRRACPGLSTNGRGVTALAPASYTSRRAGRLPFGGCISPGDGRAARIASGWPATMRDDTAPAHPGEKAWPRISKRRRGSMCSC